MHHILEKNKRVQVKKNNFFDISSDSSSQQSAKPPTHRKSKQELHKFLQSISPESKQIMQTIQAIENDLKMRVEMYGKDSASTIECLKHLVKTSNDHALHIIKKGEHRVATEILHQCEYMLLSPIGQNFPELKFQTFNNLAHAHNVQANVRLSLKYLLRALEYAAMVETADMPLMKNDDPHIPMVEAFLNTCNAYSFLGQYEDSLDFAERAIVLSQKLLAQLSHILESTSLTPDERVFFGEQYHQQVNLHAMSFHTKGQIYEKLKQFEEAIIEYQSGKQVIEQNYGPSHKLYVDFVNSINGAKLRIKYFQHSNLPVAEPYKQPKTEESGFHSVDDSQNLFLREQERIKPISQQKKLRPSSAKGFVLGKKGDDSSFMKDRKANHNSSIDLKNLRQVGQVKSLANMKNRSVKRINFYKQLATPPLSNRSTSSSNFDKGDFSKQRKKLQVKMRQYQANEHSKSSKHNHECSDCQNQLKEIRRLQLEQQKMMNMMFEQSLKQMNQSLNSNSSPNQNQDPSPQHYNQNLGQSASTRNLPPMPNYYPYPYPPYPYPPPPYYPYYAGYPPPPYPPMNNQYAPSASYTGSRNTPDKEAGWPQPPPYYGWDPYRQHNQEVPPSEAFNQGITPTSQKNQPSSNKPKAPDHLKSTHTDINERDSHFEEDYNDTLKYSNTMQSAFNNNIKHSHFIPQDSDRQPEKPQGFTEEAHQLTLKELMVQRNEAATKIQKFYKKRKCQQDFKKLLELRKQKTQFVRQMYHLYPGTKKAQKVILIVSLISMMKRLNKQIHQLPTQVTVELYDFLKKKVVYETKIKVEDLGFKEPERTANMDIFTKVKALLTMINYTGDPKKDFETQLSSLVKKYQKLSFQQDQHLNLHNNLNASFNSSKSLSSQGQSFHESINESIQDDYEEEQFSEQQSSPSPIKPQPNFNEPEIAKQNPVFQKEQEIEEESIKDEYEDHSFKEESLHEEELQSNVVIVHNSEQASPSQSSRHSCQSSVKQQALPQPDFLNESESSYSKALQEAQKKQQAILLIQSRARGFLQRNQLLVTEGKKKTIAQFIYNQSPEHMAQVRMTFKESKKKKSDLTNYTIVIKNLNKKAKKDTHKITLQVLPCEEHFMKDYLQLALEIEWSGIKISKVALNENKVNMKQMMQASSIKMTVNPVHEEVKRGFSITDIEESQTSTTKQRSLKKSISKEKEVLPVQEEAQKPLESSVLQQEKSFAEDVESIQKIEQKQDIQHQESILTPEQQQKQQEVIKRMLEERAKRVSRAQGLIRGFLQRRHLECKEKVDGYKMLMKMVRKLSDGKLYHIFLVVKNQHQITSADDPFYLITLREMKNINEIYDLEISLDMAKKIFGRKGSSTAELNRLISFESNKLEFTQMLQCLDIIDEEFSLDFKKFRALQSETPIMALNTLPDSEQQLTNRSSQPTRYRDLGHTPSPIKPLSQVQSPSISERADEDDYEDSFKEEIIEEADSKFEVSPQQQSNQVREAIQSVQPIILKQVEEQKSLQKPQSLNRKKSNPMSLRMRALLRIQAGIRGWLVRNKLHSEQMKNFKNKSNDPTKHLTLFKRGVISCCGLFFMYNIYSDSQQDHVLLTVREQTNKLTIINLKKIVFADFGEQKVEIEDMPDYIQDNFNDYGEEVLLNPKTKKLKQDWIVQLHDFLDNL